jgi:hypothetical protein
LEEQGNRYSLLHRFIKKRYRDFRFERGLLANVSAASLAAEIVGSQIAIGYLDAMQPLQAQTGAGSARGLRKYITFISLRSQNGIDFICRYEECCSCWVVDDIGASFDVKQLEYSRVRERLRAALPGELFLPPPSYAAGTIFAAPFELSLWAKAFGAKALGPRRRSTDVLL